MPKPWKLLDRWEIFRNRFLRMRVDRCELPDGRIMPDYYCLDFPDWVHILALDENNQAILIHQYRHGAGEVLLEIPGGTTDPGESTEDPLEAAKRELLEETGYESDEWRALGAHFPNPALQSNRMHTYLALNCKKVADPQLDPYEDIEVVLMSVNDLYKKAKVGQVTHSIVLAGLMKAQSHLLDILKD